MVIISSLILDTANISCSILFVCNISALFITCLIIALESVICSFLAKTLFFFSHLFLNRTRLKNKIIVKIQTKPAKVFCPNNKIIENVIVINT